MLCSLNWLRPVFCCPLPDGITVVCHAGPVLLEQFGSEFHPCCSYCEVTSCEDVQCAGNNEILGISGFISTFHFSSSEARSNLKKSLV